MKLVGQWKMKDNELFVLSSCLSPRYFAKFVIERAVREQRKLHPGNWVEFEAWRRKHSQRGATGQWVQSTIQHRAI